MKRLIYLFLFILISCDQKVEDISNYQEKNGRDYTKIFEFDIVKQLKFKLEPPMRYSTNSISSSIIDGEEIISYLDSDNQSILTFSSKSGELLKNIPLEIEGPNGVGNIGYISAHYYLNNDSIFLYNRQVSPLYLINSKGEIRRKYKVTDYSGASNFPVPNSSTMSPIHFWNNSLLFSCGIQNYEDDFTGYPSLLQLDLNDGEIDYLSTFPEIYSKAFWGAYFKYDPSIALNTRKKEVIISYPIDHNIHVFNLESGLVKQYYVGSEFFEEIPPYKNDPSFFLKRNPSERDENETNHAFSTSEYRGIIYDEWRELFYRVALIRPSIETVISGDRRFSFSIIIFNENYEKVGETKLPNDKYDPSSIFLTRDGLAVFRKDLYSKNEDILVFDVLLPDDLIEEV
jgi:hypothetical protein